MILVWVALPFVIGVVLGAGAGVPGAVSLTLAAGLALFGFTRGKRQRTLFLAAAALCLGVWRAPPSANGSVDTSLSRYHGAVVLQGVVSAEPDIRDTGANYDVSVHQVTVHGRTFATGGTVRVHTPSSQQLDYGDAVSLSGRLTTPTNRGAIPWRAILQRQGIAQEMRFPRVVNLGPTSTGWLGWIVPLRTHLEANIDSWLPEPEAALLIAILLGARSATLGGLAPALVATGLIHIIAISGIKVAMVAGTVHQLAGLLRRRLATLVLSLSALLMYVLLTGATASGVRSAVMWGLVFVAVYLGRGTVALVSLAFAAAVMVAIEPSLPWDIGFQLSTIGTFSIVALTPYLIARLRWVPSPAREALAVTMAAQVGTLPIVAAGFHVVSLSGPLANAVVLPLLPILIALGAVLGIWGAATPWLAALADLSYDLLHGLIQFSNWLASLPAALPSNSFPVWLVALYYCLLVGVAGFGLHRMNWAPLREMVGRQREVLLALIAGAALLTVDLARADGGPQARLYWSGVGEGMVLRSQGKTALIDGSARPLAYLQWLGSVLPQHDRVIDLVIVTDPRARSVMGLSAVLRHYRVLSVWDVGAQYPSVSYANWRASLGQARIPIFALRTGSSVRVGAAQVNALGPDSPCPNPSNCTGMLRIGSLHRSTVLVGTASVRQQQEAVFRPISLRADAVLWEGSGPLSPDFSAAVGARQRYHVLVPSGSSTRAPATTQWLNL